ncbi:LysR substrate-binding domain-containing protein [Marinobacterium lutimaris]|uniref:LysR family transcriptional regulator, glycine cleavage system transcriptional activator n=1 Tax=Marinobacterium lutimaris TaxID=568106 RepID=A0A1H5YZM9_9GAMM|nr:LysR substrate-binding domain-containing protein [Marinobacterium lutimaris]SEG29362.1 LysR family transcriptional regulator, glycine cleavage system transcriptional activator [Marinobacterium lutimaris]
MARPSFSSLKTFEVVARLGSLRAAGEVLHITQSAVSHQIRRLESSLQVKLMEKNGRGIRLTSSGEQLAYRLSEGFALIDEAVDSITLRKDMEQLRIVCLPSIAVRWLIPRLNRFRSRYPDYAISIEYIDVSRDEVPPDIDIQITWFDGPPRSRFDRKLICEGVTLPVASPLYLQTVAPIEQPRDLLRLDLLHDETSDSWRSWFQSVGLNPGHLERGMFYQDFNLLSSAAIAGQGIALCPPRLIETELANGTLEMLFDTPSNTSRAYWLFTHPNPRPAVQRFMDWVLEEAEQPPQI